MESKLELAAALARRLPPRGGRWALHGIADVKLRAFTPPGEKLELEARLNQLSTNAASLNVETRKDKRVISGARVLFAPEVRS
jgi:3-hydroxymyristoyl/3-hydroxydecanoyl-(acyl carrier protein) dehydratase